MRYLPVFLDVQGKRTLVLGGGEVGQRKADALRRAGAEVVFAERFSPEALEGCALAVGADAPEAELEALSAAAQARALPVNVVDRPWLCSYITPAVVDRDPLIVAIGSAGEAPVLARLVRARIEAMLPPTMARLAALAGSFAAELRARFPSPSVRRRVLERMLAGRAAALVLAGDEAAGLAEMRREVAGGEERPPGLVHLVGAGPGAADLLTMRAHRLLGEADTIVFEADVSKPVLDLARRDAAFVPAVDALAQVLDAARAGQRVVLLTRAPAPAMADAIAAAGIACELVPGL